MADTPTLHYVEVTIVLGVFACSAEEAESAAYEELAADFARHLPDFEFRAISASDAFKEHRR